MSIGRRGRSRRTMEDKGEMAHLLEVVLVLLVVRHGEDVMRCEEGEVEGLCKIRERCEGKKYQISISTKTTEIAEILLVRLRPISPACAGIGPVLCCHYLTAACVTSVSLLRVTL